MDGVHYLLLPFECNTYIFIKLKHDDHVKDWVEDEVLLGSIW